MFCRYCGKPTDSPICPDCAAVAQAAGTQEPAPEAVQPQVTPNVTTEAYPTEAYAPEAEPVMELGAEQPQPEKKKKSKKALWISLVAVLGVIGVLVALFWSPLALWFKYATTPADEMLQEAETAAFASYTDALSEYYGLLLKAPDVTQQSTDGTLQIEMNDLVADALSELLKAEDINLSADQLKNITLSLKGAAKDNLVQYSLSLKDMVDVQFAMDMQNSLLYLCVPQLNATPIKLDMSASGMNLSQFNAGSMLLMQNPNDVSAMVVAALTDSGVKSALPTQEEFDAMLDRMVSAALPALTEVEKKQDTVTVNGHDQKQIQLTTTINAVTARKMLGEVLKVAQNDATLKKLVTVVSDYVYNQTGKNPDLYTGLSNGLTSLQTNLNKEINFKGAIHLTTYVNGDMEVLGRRIMTTGFEGQTPATVYYNFVEDGDTSYFQFVLPDAPVITGSVEQADKETTTKVHLPLEGQMAIDLTVKSAENGFTLRVTPNKQAAQALLDELEIPSGLLLGNPSVELSCQVEGMTKSSVALRVLMGDTALVSMTIKGTTSTDNVQVALPQNAIDPQKDQMNAYYWAYEAVNNLPALLRKFGLSDQAIENLMYEMGSNLF
ncbi:MAG: hypothetical protein E7527_03045 [Ruminococcaceae bacterium]|nr:hypothetical protein [Oscillospiraceae bacterium]